MVDVGPKSDAKDDVISVSVQQAPLQQHLYLRVVVVVVVAAVVVVIVAFVNVSSIVDNVGGGVSVGVATVIFISYVVAGVLGLFQW